MIFYSLGNFIFDTDFQRAQKGTDEGMLIKLEFDKDSYTFESISLKNDRKNEKITIKKEENKHFKDIRKTYNKEWKKEACRFEEIKEAKKELRIHRRLFSISNLYIEKTKCENLLSFDELIKKNYIEELDNPPVFKGSNFFVRKIKRVIKKLAKANYKKFIYSKYANLFK